MMTVQVGDTEALVDDPELSAYTWSRVVSGRNVYASTKIDGRTVLMHRLVMDAAPGEQVDHINGNGLDNQRSNLRIASRFQNAGNARKRANTSSRFKGVSWRDAPSPWGSHIRLDGKLKTLGHFKVEEAAARAYDAAALDAWGEFALTNAMLDLYV